MTVADIVMSVYIECEMAKHYFTYPFLTGVQNLTLNSGTLNEFDGLQVIDEPPRCPSTRYLIVAYYSFEPIGY